MGNTASTSKASTTDATPTSTTETNTTSAPSTSTSVTASTATETAPSTTVTTTTTIEATTPKTSSATTTSVATPTTTTLATTTTPTSAVTTTTTPTSTVTTTSPASNNASTTSVSTEGTAKPTLYSVVQLLTSNDDKQKSNAAKAAVAHWYKWRNFEKQQREKGKLLWYMSTKPTNTDTDTPDDTPSKFKMSPSKKTGGNQNEVSNGSDINAIATFQLRSTAVYSPPHGDRFAAGRNELNNTDTADFNFKYYVPGNRQEQPTSDHTKATMYRTNTHLKQLPLPFHTPSSTTPISSTTTHVPANATGDTATLPTFVSRGLQTDLEAPVTNPFSTAVHYYEKQPPQLVPASAFPNSKPSNDGFYHLTTNDANNKLVHPPPEITSTLQNNQPNQPFARGTVPVNSQPYSSIDRGPMPINDQPYPAFERRPILVNDPFYLPSERRSVSVDSQLYPHYGRRQVVINDPLYLPYENRSVPVYSQPYPSFERRPVLVDDSFYPPFERRPVLIDDPLYSSFERRPVFVNDSLYPSFTRRPVFVDDPLYPSFERRPVLVNDPIYVRPERVPVPVNVQPYPVYERRPVPVTSQSYPSYGRRPILANDPFYVTPDRGLTPVNSQLQPPLTTRSVPINDQPYPPNGSLSFTQPPPSLNQPAPRPSILKKPSTSLSQDTANPLSSQTHDEVLERLRKLNNNTNDGMYRVKKVHILEKDNSTNYQPSVTFNLPSSKASQSILRSEALFSNPLVNEKK